MAAIITTYKTLGKTEVVADTNTLLYTVPALTQVVVSSVTICNTGTSPRTFRFAICPASISAVTKADYVYYDLLVPANQTFICTAGLTAGPGSQFMVRANHADVVFSLFGSEIV